MKSFEEEEKRNRFDPQNEEFEVFENIINGSYPAQGPFRV